MTEGRGVVLCAYCGLWCAEGGATQRPATLEKYRKIGAALKKKGKPIGQTLGHTFGDAPTWTYPLVWSFGGAETDPSGKKGALNPKPPNQAVQWIGAVLKELC